MLLPEQSRSQGVVPEAIVKSVSGSWRTEYGPADIQAGESIAAGAIIMTSDPAARLRIYSMSEQVEKTFEGPQARILLNPPPPAPGLLQRLLQLLHLFVGEPKRTDVPVIAAAYLDPRIVPVIAVAATPANRHCETVRHVQKSKTPAIKNRRPKQKTAKPFVLETLRPNPNSPSKG